MEAVGIIRIILSSIQFLRGVGNESRNLTKELQASLDWLSCELTMLEPNIKQYEGLPMQDLVYDIHDFISNLHIREEYADFFRSVVAMDSRRGDISSMDGFKDRIKRIQEWKHELQAASSGSSQSATSPPPSYAPEKDLVGFPKTRDELLELLSVPDDDDGQLRVISIAGCTGVGKTAFARAVYESIAVVPPPPVAEIHEFTTTFHCKAWVVASTCSIAEDLVNKVMKQVHPTAVGEKTIQDLQIFLQDKRYLVFIDDMQLDGVQWKDVVHAFPENNKGSRIIVTTTVHSIARPCHGPGSYYVYQMQCLDDENSKRLFCQKISARGYGITEAEETRLGSILGKCGGLPLALIDAANYMVNLGDLSDDNCRIICMELGNYVESNERAFGKLKRALVQCYDDLPDPDHEKCLLYVSIFPRGYQIDSKSLVRRLVSEQLVAGGHDSAGKNTVVSKCLKGLINRSMIEPVPFHNSSRVTKRCEVHGAMLEFAIQKSLSKNFISLIDEDNSYRRKNEYRVRRLTVQYSTRAGHSELPEDINKDLAFIRSLTIFKSKLLEKTLQDLKKCKVLRVLVLEGCKGLNGNSVVEEVICELVFLKYLSLRKTDVIKLPTTMKFLVRLETLDFRETEVEILPVEVIMLPELACIFGRFELPVLTVKEKNKLTEFLKEESKLHTIAGILIKSQDFEVIIVHARKLKKIKIWHDNTAHAVLRSRIVSRVNLGSRIFSRVNLGSRISLPACYGFSGNPAQNEAMRLPHTLVSSLQKRFHDLDSISIDSSVINQHFLASLTGPCYIRSIKLRGPLASPPGTLNELRNLRKLHLFSTGLRSIHLLSTLQRMTLLEYLKLSEDHDEHWAETFAVDGGFGSLKELCFEAEIKHPSLRIAQGAMSHLTSLQLLCPDSSDAPRIEGSISHLEYLKEVILHHSVNDAKMKAWKIAANRNRNRQCTVRKQPAQPNSTRA